MIINTTAQLLVCDQELFGMGTAEDTSRQGINTSIWGSRNTAYQSYVWLISMLLIPCSHKNGAPSASLKKEKTSKLFSLHQILSKQTAFKRLSIFWVAGSLHVSLKAVAHSHQIHLKTFTFTARKLDAQLHFSRVSEWSPWLTKRITKEAGLCQKCRQINGSS